MFHWFHKERPQPRLEERLRELETRAERAAPGYETQHYIEAAELCRQAGEPERALRYFGQALDRYLDSGRLAAAEALSRRMVEIAPEAVRVRGTRMWLLAARAGAVEAGRAIEEYVEAGRRAGQEDLVAYQLSLLADVADTAVRECAAEALLSLGAAAEADRLLGRLFAERNGLAAAPRAPEAGEWGERMLEATLLSPEQARQRLHRPAGS